jgi:hypothetical protein
MAKVTLNNACRVANESVVFGADGQSHSLAGKADDRIDFWVFLGDPLDCDKASGSSDEYSDWVHFT